MNGAPLTRLYPLEEIGCTAQGLQLLHDSHGRVAVAQQGEFFVLNDGIWQKGWRENVAGLTFCRVVSGPDGEIYYSVFGSWGVFKKNDQGELRPVPLVPADAPAWVRRCNFRDILSTSSGVFFWGQDGIVYLDRASGSHRYFPIERVTWLFPLGGKFFVATFEEGIHTLDVSAGTLTPAAIEGAELAPVVASAGDGISSLLLATLSQQIWTLREGRLAPVKFGDAAVSPGPVVAIAALAEGGFAVAVAGHGVFLLDQDGVVRRIFDGAAFQGVTALSSQEPGVLWAVAEGGVLKIPHGQPFTAFGRDQGLSISWPQIVRWKDKMFVSSGGRVFEFYSEIGDGRGRFRLIAALAQEIAWGIAVVGESLLVGTGAGVYEADAAGDFSLVYPDVNVARLVALDAEVCLVIATDSIVALRREGGAWVACTPRIPGIGYPYVAHAGAGTAWIELGVHRVARIALDGEALQVRVFEEFDWDERSWVNVSIVGSVVVLAASGQVPMFLNDRTLESAEAPELARLVERSPYNLQRFARDDAGNLWITHSRGLFLARAVPGGYEPDFSTFGGINEATPLVRCTVGGGVWASTDNSLYRLSDQARTAPTVALRPVLVGVRDTRTGQELKKTPGGDLGSFPYSRNSLQLDFFAGGYSLVRSLAYEYKLGAAPWIRSASGSSVLLTDLHEGGYSLEVRLVDAIGPVGNVAKFRLAVAAPWYRSWVAVATYPLVAVLVVYLASRFAVRRQRLRLADLKQQVDKRTAELRKAMDCLREETTTNATLAERNRLAGEIHDSLEQGFAGLYLQLETIARLPTCGGPVKGGLVAAINMVLYCRGELRNAVRGLHSPILQSEPLETALRQIVGQIAPLSGLASIRVDGTPRRIDPATEHHLLRITQEALGNAVKHAEATQIEVRLHYTADRILLSVVDNGRGFDPAATIDCEGCHLGLPSFTERAGKIGATVEVESAPGQGTAVRVVVPDKQTERILS